MFHVWNVKRIRPAGLVPYRYDGECYTRLLWWFEGATSYYDWRTLALSRLCSVEEYLDHLSGEIAYLDQTPGRLLQSLEQASYDAWIKLYRPDENLANTGVSYYRKGEVVCALLDIELRTKTGGRVTLDAVLSRLWTDYGATERPLPEDELQHVFERMTGIPWDGVFDEWIRGTSEIDYGRTLARVGLGLTRSPRVDGPRASLGIRLRIDGPKAIVSSVVRGTGAWSAGLGSGDEIIAIDGTRFEPASLDAALGGHKPGDEVEVTLARAGRIQNKAVMLEAPRADGVKLVALEEAPEAARAAFASWLGRAHPAWTTRPQAEP
jgi:predicted metalloprotease with PDZ domain